MVGSQFLDRSLPRENIKSMINSVVDGHSKNEKLVSYGLAVSCTELWFSLQGSALVVHGL